MSETVSIEQMLREKGVYVGTTVGTSMEPLLRTRRDVVVIEKPAGRLKKNDVPLYRRGEDYVLHRIVKVLPDSYVILGDNCRNREYGITDDDIIGVLTAFYRKGKYCTVTDWRCRAYVCFIRALRPLRLAYWALRSLAARIYHRLVT